MTVHNRLEHVFREVFDDDSLVLNDGMTASDVAGWDSVAHINLMFAIEQSFGVQFSGNQLAEFTNIGEIMQFLEGHGQQR